MREFRVQPVKSMVWSVVLYSSIHSSFDNFDVLPVPIQAISLITISPTLITTGVGVGVDVGVSGSGITVGDVVSTKVSGEGVGVTTGIGVAGDTVGDTLGVGVMVEIRGDTEGCRLVIGDGEYEEYIEAP